jgi:hypothetical protein
MLDAWRAAVQFSGRSWTGPLQKELSQNGKTASTHHVTLLEPLQYMSASGFSPQLLREWIATLQDGGRAAMAARS